MMDSKATNDDFGAGMLVGFIVGLLLALGLAAMAMSCLSHSWKLDAVKHNAAQWVTTESGNVSWMWNDEAESLRK